MSQVRNTRRMPVLPVLLVAVVALVIGSLGTAVAGDSVVAITKKTVKKIAKKQIGKAAPTLSVARAKVADSATTAATAGTATSATSAGSATTAGDVDGYSANELARAATAFEGSFGELVGTLPTTIVSTQITAPKAGILVISGQTRFNMLDGEGGTSYLEATGTVDGTVATAASFARSDIGGVFDKTVYVTGAYPVSAGTHTVDFTATSLSAFSANLFESSITVLFVPFGPAGAAGQLAGP